MSEDRINFYGKLCGPKGRKSSIKDPCVKKKLTDAGRLTMEQYKKLKDEGDGKCYEKPKKKRRKEPCSCAGHKSITKNEEEEKEVCVPLPPPCQPLPKTAPPLATFKEQLNTTLECLKQQIIEDKKKQRRQCPPLPNAPPDKNKCCKAEPRPLGQGCCRCCKCEEPPKYEITYPTGCGGFFDEECTTVISDLQDLCCPPKEIIHPTYNDFMGITDMDYDDTQYDRCGNVKVFDDFDDESDDDPCSDADPCKAMKKAQANQECMCDGGTEPCGEPPEIPQEEFFGCPEDIKPSEDGTVGCGS